jgi:hypothetical protein
MLFIQKLQVSTESLPLLKLGLRLPHLALVLVLKPLVLALSLFLIIALKLISLPVFQAEAPEIDLADVE